MSKSCDGCAKKCGGCEDKLSWRQLLMAVVASVLFYVVLVMGSSMVQAKNSSCYTPEMVSKAIAEEKKCLTIYDNKVYDFSLAKLWDLTGHVGKHLCGKVYDKETIEAGPHKVGVISKFYTAPLCGTLVESQKTGPLEFLFGGIISIRRSMVYVSLLFFLLNFATCYAMPWASIKEPWTGDFPGKDSKDTVGKFPLTHWHKIWAWMAIFSLSLHAILGFSCMLLGKCY